MCVFVHHVHFPLASNTKSYFGVLLFYIYFFLLFPWITKLKENHNQRVCVYIYIAQLYIISTNMYYVIDIKNPTPSWQ